MSCIDALETNAGVSIHIPSRPILRVRWLWITPDPTYLFRLALLAWEWKITSPPTILEKADQQQIKSNQHTNG